LPHDNEFGNAIRLYVILRHISAEGDHVDGMQPPPVGVEEGHDVDGHDLHVECFGVLEIVVPDLADNIAKEFGGASFGRHVTGKVIEAGFMGCLCTNTDTCSGVFGDGSIIEGETGGTYTFIAAMVGFVLDGLCADGREGMNSLQLVIWNDHEEREKSFPDGEQVVVSCLPFERGKGVVRLFEEAGDGVRHHVEMIIEDKLLVNEGSIFLGQRRAGAVENRDDDDQSDCIDKDS
jgi:hypothetical protein